MPTKPYAIDNVSPRRIGFPPALGDARRRLAGFALDADSVSQTDLTTDPMSADFQLSDLLKQIPQTLIQLYRADRQADVQDQLIALNIQRSQRGLPPISLNQIGGAALASPQVGVNVAMTPETKKMLVMGAVGLGALLLFATKRR